MEVKEYNELLDKVNNKDPNIRSRAIREIGISGTRDEVSILIEKMNTDRDLLVALTSIEALGSIIKSENFNKKIKQNMVHDITDIEIIEISNKVSE